MEFGSWKSDVHDNYEQMSRLSTGVTKVKPNTIDSEKATAEFIGSSGSVYHTTLNDCDCADFYHRNLPCKHIYSLAHSLGFTHELPSFNKNAAKAYDIDADVEKYTELYKNGVISIDKLSRIAKALEKGY